ncbi:MAG: glycine cleavage system protein H [Desulfobacca sp.]|nr:glycine cleavage system protein H [Desulfobacca sp.]
MDQYQIPEELKYTKEHEWVKIDGFLAVVGITDYAQHQMGDITYVDLPEIGRRVAQMEELCTIESVKVAADVYSPLTGLVVETNSELADHPEWLNQDCYGRGWLVKLQDVDSSELEDLMDAGTYQTFLAQGA